MPKKIKTFDSEFQLDAAIASSELSHIEIDFENDRMKLLFKLKDSSGNVIDTAGKPEGWQELLDSEGAPNFELAQQQLYLNMIDDLVDLTYYFATKNSYANLPSGTTS